MCAPAAARAAQLFFDCMRRRARWIALFFSLSCSFAGSFVLFLETKLFAATLFFFPREIDQLKVTVTPIWHKYNLLSRFPFAVSPG